MLTLPNPISVAVTRLMAHKFVLRQNSYIRLVSNEIVYFPIR